MKKTHLIALLLVLALAGAWFNQQGGRSHAPSVASGGGFDYYLLTLSWSPTFCLSHPDNEQCSGKGYGFVLHGLWPQYAKGGWPQDCGQAQPLSREQRSLGRTLFPTAGLLEHEWKKHGTCTGLGADGYLRTADKALGLVKVPAALQPSTTAHYFDADDIAQLFRQSNPGLPEDGIVVTCNGPELAEVRVCLAKDLAFAACGKGVKGQCRAGKVRVPGIR
ncbi:ribonuclease T2 family protein [Pseudomonas abieticivorans]|uniref:ribonuclease T2 family protein n=1 Tax=Pseudomonas abieticivorans TaxID=2931382 RepID=UPI003F68EA25